MKARTLIRFNDLKAETIREVGDEFVITRERFDEIRSRGPFVEEVAEEVGEVEPNVGKRKKRVKGNE